MEFSAVGCSTYCTILSGYNVASIARLSAGAYQINFTTAMPDSYYAWSGSALMATTGGGANAVTVGTWLSDQQTASFLQMHAYTYTGWVGDPDRVSIMVIR